MVLRGVSFEAAPGQVIALAGEPGSGKRACLELLQLFDKPTGGEIVSFDLSPIRFSLIIHGKSLPAMTSSSLHVPLPRGTSAARQKANAIPGHCLGTTADGDREYRTALFPGHDLGKRSVRPVQETSDQPDGMQSSRS